jgi:hypothetical protein
MDILILHCYNIRIFISYCHNMRKSVPYGLYCNILLYYHIIRSTGPDIACGTDVRVLTHESFRRKEATIGRAFTPGPLRAHLQSAAQPEGAQPDKLRREGSVQRGVQGSTTAETSSQKHPQGVVKMDRRFLLRPIRDYCGGWLHL